MSRFGIPVIVVQLLHAGERFVHHRIARFAHTRKEAVFLVSGVSGGGIGEITQRFLQSLALLFL